MKCSSQARHGLKPLTLAALALLTRSAWSQVSEPPAAADAPPKLETVVVSAQRRLERLQDVPASVKAFSSKQIESMGISSTQDFVNLTPNMSFDNSFTYGNSFIVLRGVTQINNADSPVAVVVDGVPQNNQKQLKMNLFDIERIEVLKGPQGALYGRNAIGGAINIETKAPGNKLVGFVGAEVGNGNVRELSGGVSGALAPDTALFRVVAQTKSSDGLITNTYSGAKVDAVGHDNSLRAKLLLKPSAGLQIDLRANVIDYAAGATWDSIVTDRNPATIVAPRSNILGRTEGHTDDLSAKVQYELNVGTLTSITSYTNLTERYRGDVDFSNPTDSRGGFLGLGFQAGQGQNLGVRMTSQELRLTSPDDLPVRWIGGLYYLNTLRNLETRAFIDIDSSTGQWDDAAKTIVHLQESNHNRSSALFGQVDVDFSKQLTLSSALRYDRDQRKQTNVLNGNERSATYSKWQPKFTLTQKYSRDTLAYATLSTGFRSGGFNAPSIPDFKAETLSNAEIGAKTILMEGRFLFNAALFVSRSKDFQFFKVDIASGSQVITNIDSVALKGLDMDFRFLPMKGLEFDGGLGITASSIRRSTAEPGTVGNHTPKTVPFKINFGAQYTQPLGNGLEGLLRADYEHRDKKYWHPDNLAVSPALDLLGLRIGVRDAKDRWSVTLVGRNLANKRYYADYNSSRYSGLPYDIGSLATGRTVGLEAKFRL
ncbi:TonB-dependent receptor [Paucibacter sp. DJ2R-2]|uniref:TonB-dependent receptor n=1 Tax=Paucibacter sp. DJ2R-2 TaxID=2893558 RepID=UPI0021E43E8D|nr:TonB-dependent receptor [Paucibacter sp. DJ2R-2]MCV2438603.1 TonB-dependent receptor [Paucibacter sp. DJ2R-2]